MTRPGWRVWLPLLLTLSMIWLSALTIFRAGASGWYRLLSPGLLLYGSVYASAGIVVFLRKTADASVMLWESIGWATLGLLLAVVLGQPQPGRIVLIFGALLLAAILFEQRPVWQGRAHRLSLQTLGLLVGVLLFLPLLWMLTASLRGPELGQQRHLDWLPQAPSLSNYRQLTQLIPLGHYLTNSLLLVALGVPLSLLVAAAAGFALVFMPARWRRVVLLLSVVGLAVPSMALWLSRFLIFRWLHLLNTPLVLLMPVLLGGSPLCVLFLYRAFRHIPGEQWDQARIDGAGPWRTWWAVGLPQVGRMLVALGVLVFVLFWGNYTDPLLYLADDTWQTLPVGLQALQQLIRTEWPILMAGTVVATVPPLLMFSVAQRALLDPLATTPRS